MKIKPAQLERDSPLIEMPPADPPLTKANAGGRFVIAPPELWPEISCAGWCAKIMSVHRGNGMAMVKFHDSTQHFAFSEIEQWKPLS